MNRITLILFTVAAIASVAVYGIWLKMSNTSAGVQSKTCAASKQLAATLRPLSTGEVAGVLIPSDPKIVPDLAFLAPDGMPRTLSSMRGKVLLVNLWATWCAPCRKEMPALDRFFSLGACTQFQFENGVSTRVCPLTRQCSIYYKGAAFRSHA